MITKKELTHFIDHKIKEFEHVLYGVADISYSEYANEFQCAIVLAIPHKEIVTLSNYKEQKLEDKIIECKDLIESIVPKVTDIFDMYGIKYYVPPVAQSDEHMLRAPFSFKYAAVNAGLGFIGKNGVLITKEYGPRVRLSAILIDYDLEKGNPIVSSRCPDDCFQCVDACPHKALKGKQWNINSLREELIDYHLCNEKRKLFIKKHGRKHACGYCIVACPIGANNKD